MFYSSMTFIVRNDFFLSDFIGATLSVVPRDGLRISEKEKVDYLLSQNASPSGDSAFHWEKQNGMPGPEFFTSYEVSTNIVAMKIHTVAKNKTRKASCLP